MSDPSSRPGELTFTRVFEAPRELVFRCMIEPEHLTCFWSPAGVRTPLENIKVDPRPEGCSRPSWSTTRTALPPTSRSSPATAGR
jgi:uncharacterized protein YndB with AHSA1/START domain